LLCCSYHLLLFVDEDGESEEEYYEYHPEQSEILFESKSSIPQKLLLSVVECYCKIKEYCKRCYYRNNEQVSNITGGRFNS